MSIFRLHHANITIPEGREHEAREFYCDALGLTEIPKPQPLRQRGGFWLELGQLQIHISTEAAVDRWQTKAHLAYQVDDLAAWRERIEALGIAIEEQPPFSGFERFLCRDPFGNRLELIQQVSSQWSSAPSGV